MANIHKFKDNQRGRDPLPTEVLSASNTEAAIIIENGSYECKAGISIHDSPSLIFKNLALRLKGRNNDPDTVSVGRDIENTETFRNQLKSPFDRNVVTQFDTQEMICDYVFDKLGVNSDQCVTNPIVMSEPVANPNHCRKFMSELMFECYCVPSVIYYTDALGSWYHSKHGTEQFTDGILVSVGYQSTHVVPVIGGMVSQENIKRVSAGGYHLDCFMQKLLQLKYPIHSSAISITRAEEIVQSHSWIATNYETETNRWLDIPYYEKMVRLFYLI